MRSEFSRLAAKAGVARTASLFLARGYELKTIADYETDPAAMVHPTDCEEAIATARWFVEEIAQCIRRQDQ